MLRVIVVLGFFSGCFGPLVAFKPDPDGTSYLYKVEMTCNGPHDNSTDHEKQVHFIDWFTVEYLSPLRGTNE